jgi:hypothetical protein
VAAALNYPRGLSYDRQLRCRKLQNKVISTKILNDVILRNFKNAEGTLNNLFPVKSKTQLIYTGTNQTNLKIRDLDRRGSIIFVGK